MKKAESETDAALSQKIMCKYPKQEAPWTQIKQKYYWGARGGPTNGFHADWHFKGTELLAHSWLELAWSIYRDAY